MENKNLVTELRNYARYNAEQPSLLLDAAAEIERLQEVLSFPRLTPEAPAEQHRSVLSDHEKGRPVNGQDLINALMWRLRNQSREISNLHKRLEGVEPKRHEPLSAGLMECSAKQHGGR